MAETDTARRRGVDIMGVPVDDVDQPTVVDHIIGSLLEGVGGWVVTPNVDIVRQTVGDPELTWLVSRADLSLPDGMPLVWASRLQGTPLGQRVAASELLGPLAERAAGLSFSIFLLGAGEGVAERAAEVLVARCPRLRIAGTLSPPPGFEASETETGRVLDALESSLPDIVLCAFGFPRQERLMAVLTRRFPQVWFIGVGGSLSMVAGITPQAPAWMRRHGLEWLHRLRLEPRRLFRRYVVDDGPFAFRLLAASARNRFRRRAG